MSCLPTWQGIPFDIKEDIVKYLDYKSRFRLRVCSKSDLALVDGCPLALEQVELYATPHESAPNFPHILYINSAVGIRDHVLDHFFGVFMHRKSIVKSLILGLDCSRESSSELVAQLAMKIASGGVRIKARDVRFVSGGYFDARCLQVFKVLDPQEIFSISIGSNLHRNTSNEYWIYQTEVWKNAKQLCLGKHHRVSSVPIDRVLHAENLRLLTPSLLPEDVWKLINAFITRSQVLPGFGFVVSFFNEMSEKGLEDKFEVKPRKVSTSPDGPRYHFPTTDPDLIFVLRVRLTRDPHRRCFRFKLEGIICRKSNPEDFTKFHDWSPVEIPQVSQRVSQNLPRPGPTPIESAPSSSMPFDFFSNGR